MVSRDDASAALAAALAAALGDEGAATLLDLMGGEAPAATLGLEGLPIEISVPAPPREGR